MKLKTKKIWKNIEITKVKLNPEQAVLSCCDSSNRRNWMSDGGRNACENVFMPCGSGTGLATS
jgi:hypothetical protein